MTRLDFIELADALKSVTLHDDDETVNFFAVLEAIADCCQKRNSNFKRRKWLTYIRPDYYNCIDNLRD